MYADGCIGTVVEGFEESVLRIRKVPGEGFLGDAKKHVLIKAMTIQVYRASEGGYVEWKEGMATEDDGGDLAVQ